MPKYQKYNLYQVPPVVAEVLNRKKQDQIPTTTFVVRELTGELRPPRVPNKRGDTVPVVLGKTPPGQENNVIAILEDVDGNHKVFRWMPSHLLRIGQLVSFWKNGFTYIFQIQMTDREGIGEFVFLRPERAEKMPGRLYRTTKAGKK